MMGFAISLSLLLSQGAPPRVMPRTGNEAISAEVYRIICEPAPDIANARNSTLYAAAMAMSPNYRMSEADWNRLTRASREQLVAEAYERERLRAIADFPRLGNLIVDTLNRYGNGESARVVSLALQGQICR